MASQEQIDYFQQNTIKNAEVQTWVTVQFTHPDWSNDLNFVAIEENRGVEFDESIYTFEGIHYKPVSMTIQFPQESDRSVGNATINFARAATGLKKLMREITPQNANQPITCDIKQYQEGTDLPVKEFNGFVSKDYPKISGQDIQIQASRFNPAMLTSDFIVTLERYPELAQS